MVHTWTRPPFSISDDPSHVDLELVHGFLRDSYWARGIELDLVRRSLAGSLCLSLHDASEQVGFARVVSDRATFAWLGDVFVLPRVRRQGLGSWLVRTALEHPELEGIRRWHLVTRDAQPLYRPFDFREVAEPGMHLERLTGPRPKLD